jgi:hypothetical protein
MREVGSVVVRRLILPRLLRVLEARLHVMSQISLTRLGPRINGRVLKNQRVIASRRNSLTCGTFEDEVNYALDFLSTNIETSRTPARDSLTTSQGSSNLLVTSYFG